MVSWRRKSCVYSSGLRVKGDGLLPADRLVLVFGVSGPGSPPSPREDLVKSSPPLLIRFTFHRSVTRTVTHLLVPHLVATTFPSTTPLNRQINAAIKSTRRLWWRSSKTARGSAAIKDLMKSDFRRDRKSPVAVRRFTEWRLLRVLDANGPNGSDAAAPVHNGGTPTSFGGGAIGSFA